MFQFHVSRRPVPGLPRKSAAEALTATSVPGLDYYEAEAGRSAEAEQTPLSPERAALDQAFGYWSES